jgi:hypothetical protein
MAHANRWGGRLVFAGVLLMVSPLVTVLFLSPIVALSLLVIGELVTAIGIYLSLSE